MTESRSALSAAARKQIIAGLKDALAVFERTGRKLSAEEEVIRNNLRRICRELEEQGEGTHPRSGP